MDITKIHNWQTLRTPKGVGKVCGVLRNHTQLLICYNKRDFQLEEWDRLFHTRGTSTFQAEFIDVCTLSDGEELMNSLAPVIPVLSISSDTEIIIPNDTPVPEVQSFISAEQLYRSKKEPHHIWKVLQIINGSVVLREQEGYHDKRTTTVPALLKSYEVAG